MFRRTREIIYVFFYPSKKKKKPKEVVIKKVRLVCEKEREIGSIM